MRCVACEKDTKPAGKGRPASKCGHCGHLFALNPKVDGIADMVVKKLIDGVTAKGEHRYLQAQLEHELEGRLTKRSKGFFIFLLVAVAVAAGAAFFLLHAVVGLLVGAAGYFAASRWHRKPRAQSTAKRDEAVRLLQRYDQLNPPNQRVDTAAAVPALGPDDVVHDRVLVCQRPDHAAFYRENGFALTAACHVACPADPAASREALVAAVRTRTAPGVFLVHDLTPAGLAFAEALTADPEWFADHPGARRVDLGLTTAHGEALSDLARPLASDEGTGAIAGLPEGTGLRLTLFRPKVLLELTRKAMEDEAAFVLPSKRDGAGAALAMTGDAE